MIQVKELTDKQKAKMYKKCSKKELIRMLIEANNHIDRLLVSNSLFVTKIEDDNPCLRCPNYKDGAVCHCTLPYTGWTTF